MKSIVESEEPTISQISSLNMTIKRKSQGSEESEIAAKSRRIESDTRTCLLGGY